MDGDIVHRCLKCGTIWSKYGSNHINRENISDGWCPKCFRQEYADKVHARQLREGYSACFAKGFEDCSEMECAFRFACLEIIIDQWKEAILEEED